jgi:CheY-like chemotaxis protein
LEKKSRLDKRGGLIQCVQHMEQGDSNSTRTVLIVDDDEEIRHALRLLCESENMEVVGEAANGVEAVPLALHQQPNIVILDYMLPRLDGEGAAEILRAVTPESKIVAFSALLDEQPPWADAYLNKDRISELMPLLRTFIR